MRQRYWFGRRRTSYGGMPITWQGWASVALLALALGAAALLPWPATVPAAALAVAAFLILSVAKGPIHTRWHWSGQDD